MNSAPYSVVVLDAVHERASFSSDSEPLNRYFQQQVTQDIRRRVAACFVAVTDEQRVAGYYTLAATSVLLAELPASVGKKLPRYPSVPAVRVGRLAVDQAFQRQGLGGALLADAFTRSVRSEIAAFALIVDAKHQLAARFYLHHGFVALPNNPLSLFLPLATARRAM
jgi:ribosomal protein S18 acetylase RimI-like enzyme